MIFDLQGHGRGVDNCQSSSPKTDKRGTGSHSRPAFRERGVLQEHVTHSQVHVTVDVSSLNLTYKDNAPVDAMPMVRNR